MAGAKRRTKRVASNRAMSAGKLTLELIGPWDAAQDLVAHGVALSHPKPGWAVLMFPDASDEHWGICLTQLRQGQLDRGVPVEDCLLYTSPSPRDLSTSRMPSSA